ncbi:T9SS type A sorting domain-containing protein [Flavobacterium sp. NKUCC04_CG]|uniref:T9SS type A sorting domain-containing protein n=1 Tax=Flavobacterium sp. NKUCC04_CG TaxID=2842121 RepID=UPI001C5B061C|nr:T9SS type A sorting domain-containing protein [Flavobacterium sp. NKUCC04_CG]MBW3518102.1 T9SS type A sorting domain-containing protein [Flavobacterium sp. NKUCC04_CG]
METQYKRCGLRIKKSVRDNGLILLLSLFLSVPGLAQDYHWKWHKKGGGAYGMILDKSYWYNRRLFETILDIKIDAQNNVYLLGVIGYPDAQFDGNPVKEYNRPFGGNQHTDVFLAALNCEGTVLWTKGIGGYSWDYAYNLGLDANGGLYVGMLVDNFESMLPFGPFQYTKEPPHFDDDVRMDYSRGLDPDIPNVNFKTMVLAKYQADNGRLLWHRFPQGEVTRALGLSQIGDVYTEANGTTHWFVGFLPGTHLDGQITVEAPEIEPERHYQWYIIRYDSEGNYVSHTFLDFRNLQTIERVRFTYDPLIERYYIGGVCWDSFEVISYGDEVLLKSMYVLALDKAGNKLWSHDMAGGILAEIKTDEQSNVYLSGMGSAKFNDLPYVNSFVGLEFPEVNGDVLPYILKLNTKGQLLWGTAAKSLSSTTSVYSSARALAFTASEVVAGITMDTELWGTIASGMIPNDGYLPDPYVGRFDKITGHCNALHRIKGPSGYHDGLTAIAVDRDQNILVGGHFSGSLFVDDPHVPRMTPIFYSGIPDFFVAKLAAWNCGENMSTPTFKTIEEVVLYPNPTSDKVYWQSDRLWKYYEVYDLQARIVAKGHIQLQEVSLAHLASGQYILALLDYDGHKVTQKILVK